MGPPSRLGDPVPVRLTELPVRRLAAWAFALAAVAIPVGSAAASADAADEPVTVVEDFFAAIARKDVDGALALVDRLGGGIPVGPEAAFLDPQAIADDWGLVSATEVQRRDDRATVRVRLAGPAGTAEGNLFVERGYQRPWRMHEPFVLVEPAASPLSFVQVNALSVPIGTGPVANLRFWLFPGLYSFYPDLPVGVTGPEQQPVMAFPAYQRHVPYLESASYPLAAGELTATEPVVSAVEDQLAAIIDDCATFSTPVPYGCPFATDGEIDTPDGVRVRDPSDLEWSVSRYPQISLVDTRDELRPAGFQVVAQFGGEMILTGTGVDSNRDVVDFTIACGIELAGYTVTIGADGEIALSGGDQRNTNYSNTANTCHRNP